MSNIKELLKTELISINISGYELELALESILRRKLGKIAPKCIEFSYEKLKNKHVLNDEDNNFTLYVEYTRGER
jgi:hypothetical protein